MTLAEALIQPFTDYGFMRRALVACVTMAVSGAPLGVFLVLRRMTLMGEATSHAILPGAALAFLVSGLSLWPMTLGGLAAGLAVALVAGVIARATGLKEDASYTAAYLTSLALGVLLISVKGNAVDLLHILFGNVLAVDHAALTLVDSIATVSLLTLALIYRPLIMECFDPGFLKAQGGRGGLYHQLFLVAVVLNLVAAFQVLGTLMAVGIMVLPAIATRFWTRHIDAAMGLSAVFGALSAVAGLLWSYHYSLPSGPAIVLAASAWYAISVCVGPCGGLLPRYFPRKHFHTLALLALLYPVAASAQGKLQVVASFSVLGDMVREVGGDEVQLAVLVGPDSDAHAYEPTPAAVKALAHADVVIVNGLGLEGWLDRLIAASGYRGMVLTATVGISPLASAQGTADPHAWQSLANGLVYVANIRDALCVADPAHAAQYRANAVRYSAELEELDAWVRAQVATVPPSKRKVISTHDAFRYFARAYGVEFLAPLGVNSEAQPSAADLAQLERQLRAQHITAVFLENMTDTRLITQLEMDAGAHIGGTLYSDALSAASGPAPSYTALFRHNVLALTAAMRQNPAP